MKKIFWTLVLLAGCYSIHAQEKREFVFSNGKVAYMVKNADDLWGVEDSNGKTIVPQKFIDLEQHGNTVYCRILVDGKKRGSTIFDSEGNQKIVLDNNIYVKEWATLKGKEITWVHEGLYKDVVLDENGNILFKFWTLKDPAGFWYIKNALVDTLIVEPGKYTELSFRKDHISAKIGKKEGALNLDGSIIFPPLLYRRVIPVREGITKGETRGFRVSYSSSNGYEGFLDRQGNCIIPADRFTAVNPSYKNGSLYQFYVKTDGKLGSFIEYPFKKALPLPEKKEKVFEYNDSSIGKIFNEEDYDLVVEQKRSKINGFSLLKNGTEGFANPEKKIIIPVNRYHSVSSIRGEGSFFIVEYKGKEGLCDKEGKEIIKPIYDAIEVRNGMIIASVGLMKGIIDMQGKTIVPFEYH